MKGELVSGKKRERGKGGGEKPEGGERVVGGIGGRGRKRVERKKREEGREREIESVSEREGGGGERERERMRGRTISKYKKMIYVLSVKFAPIAGYLKPQSYMYKKKSYCK